MVKPKRTIHAPKKLLQHHQQLKLRKKLIKPPKPRHGIKLYHATSQESAASILRQGLRSLRYNEGYATLARLIGDTQLYMSYDRPAILRIEMPRSARKKFLQPLGGKQGIPLGPQLLVRGKPAPFYGLKKPVPAKYIKIIWQGRYKQQKIVIPKKRR